MVCPRNLALIQNPGWNKTVVNCMCKMAVWSLSQETGGSHLLDDTTEKAVIKRMKKVGPVLGLYPELDLFFK